MTLSSCHASAHASAWFVLPFFLLLIGWASNAPAATNSTDKSFTASDRVAGKSAAEAKLPSISVTLKKALAAEATINWQDVPLRDALTRLGKTLDLPWFLDRRVDPRKLVQLEANRQSIASMLDAFAQRNELSVLVIDQVIYFGPPSGAFELLEARQRPGPSNGLNNDSASTTNRPTLNRRKDSPRPSARLRRTLAAKASTDWPRLTEPRRLVEQLASESRVALAGDELMPHDLWAAGHLPELSLADRLTLLLVGFELGWEVDTKGQSIRVEPRGEHPIGNMKLPRLADQIKADSSPSKKRRVAKAVKRGKSDEQRYSLRIESQPLRAVLSQIAKSAKRTLVVEPDAEALIDERVSIAVEKVTLEALVKELAAAAGLSATVDAQRVVIRSRKE